MTHEEWLKENLDYYSVGGRIDTDGLETFAIYLRTREWTGAREERVAAMLERLAEGLLTYDSEWVYGVMLAADRQEAA